MESLYLVLPTERSSSFIQPHLVPGSLFPVSSSGTVAATSWLPPSSTSSRGTQAASRGCWALSRNCEQGSGLHSLDGWKLRIHCVLVFIQNKICHLDAGHGRGRGRGGRPLQHGAGEHLHRGRGHRQPHPRALHVSTSRRGHMYGTLQLVPQID